MAIKHLDLEEQEQLEELKHFWKKYGNPITWVLIVILAAFAAWNGYQYWERKQSGEASMLYDEVDRAVQSGDMTRVDRSLADMKDKYASSLYTQQAALLAARAYYDKGNTDSAGSALTFVADKSSDDGYKSIARLRLAGLLIEKKSYDDALKQLSGNFSKDFAPLADDRRGDVLMAQGKKPEAKAEYEKAWKGLDERAEYRRLVEVKLNALGVDPTAGLAKPATSSNGEVTK